MKYVGVCAPTHANDGQTFVSEDRPFTNITARPVRSTVPDLLGAGDVFLPLRGRVIYTMCSYDSAHVFSRSIRGRLEWERTKRMFSN